jgi:RecA-family ATPase
MSDALTPSAAVAGRTERDASEWVRRSKPNGARQPRFRLLAFNDIKPDDAANYLIKGLFPRVGLAVIWGSPKCGKSFWAFDLLMHVALGWDYRGHRVCAGPVVYCALEGALGFKNRAEAFRQGKLAEADGESPPFYLMETPLSLVADAAQLVADIRAQLGVAKPVAVCIDTLNRSLAGSESSDEDMSNYIRGADAIRDAFGCLVVIIHHCGHNAERPRGHSSLMGALDAQIGVRRDAADNIVAELELSKDGEVGLRFERP